MYHEETLLIVSALAGIAAALVVHGLSVILSRSLGGPIDLVDRLGAAVSKDGEPSPARGIGVLLLGGAVLGLLYGSLVYALGLNSPTAVFGFSVFLGFAQGTILVVLLAQGGSVRRISATAKGGFIHPIAAEIGMHCCFGLLIGGVLTWLSLV